MRVCIHRGAHEIGGTCVEIESQGKQIVLDIGLPLDSDIQDVPLPPVKGFDRPDESLLGVVISHPHQDHYGLAGKLPTGTPLLIGSGAERILEAASVFVPGKVRFDNVIHLQARMPIALGPFIVTPFLMDHSAYDAYAILVEADGKRLFYSGNLQAHGRKAKLFERFWLILPRRLTCCCWKALRLGEQGWTMSTQPRQTWRRDLSSLFARLPGCPWSGARGRISTDSSRSIGQPGMCADNSSWTCTPPAC